jgi:hypothetical protein
MRTTLNCNCSGHSDQKDPNTGVSRLLINPFYDLQEFAATWQERGYEASLLLMAKKKFVKVTGSSSSLLMEEEEALSRALYEANERLRLRDANLKIIATGGKIEGFTDPQHDELANLANTLTPKEF